MRPTLFAPLLLVACATTGDRPATGDAEIAGLIAGRTAGPVTDCIDQVRVDGLRAVDDRTIVAGAGRRVWLNRLPESCPSLRPDAILIVQSFNAQYCRNDMVTPVLPGSIPGGACRLGTFTPYDKPAR